MNIFADLLKEYAKRNPQGNAIYYGTDRRETWKEVNDRVNSLANALYDFGIRKGDKGIIMFHNCPEFVESTWALRRLGAVVSPMNFNFVPREIEYQTNHSDAKVFLMEDLWLENVKKVRPNMPKVENYIVSGESGEFLNYEDLIREYPSREPPEVEIGEEDVASLLYTGGTSGLPKGVVHVYRESIKHLEGVLGTGLRSIPQLRLPKLKLPIPFGSVIADIIGSDLMNDLIHMPIIQKIAADPGLLQIIMYRILPLIRGRPILELKFFTPPPLFHAASFGVIMDSIWIQTGIAPLVFQKNPRFDPVEILEIIDKVKPAWMWLVPPMWYRLLEVPDIDKYDKSSLFELNSGAGICPSELKRRILEKFPGTLFSDQFGQTEMSPIAISKWDSSADLEKISDRDLGVPLTTIEMRVVNEKGEDAKPGEIGEILYKSPTVMKEYYKDEEKTRKTITDGYFHSGDLGYFDENGKLRLVDRASEMINVGGENVYPHEVEEILETNQKVEYAALLGVKDEEYGQVPMALIKLREGEKATEEEIIDFCRGKMSGIKRPRFVEFVEEFPINPVGKIERRKAKEKFEEVMEEGHRRWRKERR